MEFTRYLRNLDESDHPDSDPFSPDRFPELDRELILLADELQAAGHAAFNVFGNNNAAGQEHEADFLQDDELDQDSDDHDPGDQDSESERDVGLELDGAFWHVASDESSIASLSSQQPSSESESDSDSPGSNPSQSSAGSGSPSNDSTASEDSLFVTQGHEDDDLLAHLYVHEQLEQHASLFPFQHGHGERLRQSMANLHRRERDIQRSDLPSPLANLLAAPRHPPQRVESPEDDELFEMEVGRWPLNRSSRGDAPEPVRVPASAPVIDLTNEPDSPEEITASSFRNRTQAGQANGSSSRRHRANPRRQQLLGRTPSLSRSDGSILGAAPVIDLTLEDDDVELGPLPNRRPSVLPPPIRRRPAGDARRPIDLVVENPDEGMVNRILARFNTNPMPSIGTFVSQIMGEQIGGVYFPVALNNNLAGADGIANPLANNIPNFNYRGNGYNNQGEPKPPFIPPPQARPGFGRDTAEDVAFVCPSCEEELKYDPDAEQAKARPAKKARNRKDREEHHFWAVKECGHVSDDFPLSPVPNYTDRGVYRSIARSVLMTAARSTRDRLRPSSALQTQRQFSALLRTAAPTSVPRATGSVYLFDRRRLPVSVFFFIGVMADGQQAGASRLLFIRRNGGYGRAQRISWNGVSRHRGAYMFGAGREFGFFHRHGKPGFAI